MKKYTHTFLGTVATTLVISMAGLSPLSANENPFQIPKLQPNTPDRQLAQGRCGRCGGSMQGRCGGMMGGAKPRALDPAKLPEPDSDSARLVAKYCTQCHGLPDPKQHSASDWSITIARMNSRMQWMSSNNKSNNIAAPSEKELAELTSYLQSNALTAGQATSSDAAKSQ